MPRARRRLPQRGLSLLQEARRRFRLVKLIISLINLHGHLDEDLRAIRASLRRRCWEFRTILRKERRIARFHRAAQRGKAVVQIAD